MSSSDDMVSKLQQLNRDVAIDLWKIHRGEPRGPKLILPAKRDTSSRISEQESKIIYCHHLEQSDWMYSIETPTTQTYVQSGKSPLSARVDISLYTDRDVLTRCANIELKAHNPPIENFRKDLEKLHRENLTGVWFHTLKNTNSSTFPSIFRKIREAYRKLGSHLGETKPTILFGFCVLERRHLLEATLRLESSGMRDLDQIDHLFDPHTVANWNEWTDSSETSAMVQNP